MHLHYNMGHMGIEKTLSRAEEGLLWPRYVNVIQERLLICYVCVKTKAPRLELLLNSNLFHWEVLWSAGTRICGLLPETERGNRYSLVITDHLPNGLKHLL